MKVKNLNTYDYIMIWGAGQQFQSRFRNGGDSADRTHRTSKDLQ